MDFKGDATPLREGDVETVAGYLGCELAVLRAVMQVESNGKAFHSDGRPIILNEPHVFYRELRAGPLRDQAVSAGLAYKKWKTKPYLKTQAERYAWLDQAVAIDRSAALRSCSWGLGQVMGFNHRTCGFDSAEAFVKAMMHSEAAQLFVIARFIVGNKLQKHLRNKDWAQFAKGYNGSGYATHGYHTRLAQAYNARPASERVVPPAPDEAQLNLLLGGLLEGVETDVAPQPGEPDPQPDVPEEPAAPPTQPSEPPAPPPAHKDKKEPELDAPPEKPGFFRRIAEQIKAFFGQ